MLPGSWKVQLILCFVQVVMYDLSCFLDANLILLIHLFLSKLTEEDVE